MVCEKCLPGLTNSNCPTCRTEMGSGVNLVAREVLKILLLPCTHPTCKAILKQDELQVHQLTCEERPVACPGVGCKQKRPLSQLVDHAVSECVDCTEDGAENMKMATLKVDREELEGDGDFSFLTSMMRFKGKIFFVRFYRQANFYAIEVVLLGTKDECALFSASAIFFKNGVPVFESKFSLRPIDEEKPVLCPSFKKEGMEDVFNYNPDREEYTVTYKMKLKSLNIV